MDARTTECIEQIHQAGRRLVFEFAGAGSQALAWLHAVPGSSRTIVEAGDRYAAAALSDLLGALPAHAVARETAIAMAEAAYERAMYLSDGAASCVGLGCTAAVATDRARHGADQAWVATRDRETIHAYHLLMSKQQRTRADEEQLVSRLIVHAIARACGIADAAPLQLLADEQSAHESLGAPEPLAALIDGAARSVTILPDGARQADAPVSGVLLSGSFNPLHLGHEQLAHAAGEMLGLPWSFELPIANADKPPLGYSEIMRRLAPFAQHYTVRLSREPLFVDKAALFPGCVFAVGYDTAVRLIEPRYYGGSAARDAALARIRAHGCRFIVGGRSQDGIFRTLADIALPAGFHDLFIGLPERLFHLDISSSAIRAWRGAAG